MITDLKEATVESSGALGRSLPMEVSRDPKALIHLMSLLTNLYNDPETAVIREYYTNGLDAHARVGQTLPVEIYTPTMDNPLYTVKDSGVGMSEEDIDKTYRFYGESTKRETNNESGAFGLGCKAALAIATQFTLTSIKDGVKTTALISKTESGINNVDILPGKKTEEGNGTTVTVPVSSVAQFNNKVTQFFRYTDASKVLINGRKPKTVFEDSMELDTGDPDLKLFTKKEMNGWSKPEPTYAVIMGGVGYTLTKTAINDSIARLKISGFELDRVYSSLYICVGIGDVNLTPNREGLRYTDKTNALIDKAIGIYVSKIRATGQEALDVVENRGDVWKAWKEWDHILDEKARNWRGELFDHSIQLLGEIPIVRRLYGDSDHLTSKVISLFVSSTVVYGHDPEQYRKVSKWISSYMKSRGLSSQYFYFVKDLALFSSPWFSENNNFTFISADDMIAEAKAQRKKDREANTTPKSETVKIMYPVYDLKTGAIDQMPYDTIPAGTPYFDARMMLALHDYVAVMTKNRTSYNQKQAKKHWALSILPQMFDPNVVKADKLILVPSSRKIDALVKRVPGTHNVQSTIREYLSGQFSDLPDRVVDIATIKSDQNMSKLLGMMKVWNVDPAIKDRDIRKMITPKRRDRMHYERLLKLRKRYANTIWGQYAAMPSHSSVVQTITNRYPLIRHIDTRNITRVDLDHMVSYLNAIHDETLTIDA